MRIKVKINRENKWDMTVDVYALDLVVVQDIHEQVSLCVYDSDVSAHLLTVPGLNECLGIIHNTISQTFYFLYVYWKKSSQDVFFKTWNTMIKTVAIYFRFYSINPLVRMKSHLNQKYILIILIYKAIRQMHLLLFLILRRWKQSKRKNFKGSWKNSSRLAHTVKNLRYYFGPTDKEDEI